MSRRSQLEHEVSVAQERVKKAAKDTPKDIIKVMGARTCRSGT